MCVLEKCHFDHEIETLQSLYVQSLELWNMSQNKTMTLPAHDGLITSLAVSTATGLVASASHDKLVKLWK